MIINEPTAAAIVYGLDKKVDDRGCERRAHPYSSLILVEELSMFLS
jgi:molecular chaperone DnaK (HSP70)